jgi:hypothetical protein
MGTHWKDGYSSHVDLALIVNGETLRLAQVGPESLILQTPCDLEPGFADLIITIDDLIEKYRIAIYEGSSAQNPIVRYDAVGAVA